MQGAIFIGDELTATGFRLAGCEVATPGEGQTAQIFEAACATYAVIMVGSTHARHLNKTVLDEAIKALEPLVIVLPDVLGQTQPEDLVAKTSAILGIEK